jgi:hypothetical protein
VRARVNAFLRLSEAIVRPPLWASCDNLLALPENQRSAISRRFVEGSAPLSGGVELIRALAEDLVDQI